MQNNNIKNRLNNIIYVNVPRETLTNLDLSSLSLISQNTYFKI